MTDRLKRGDFVRVRLSGDSGEWTPAFVAIASNFDRASVMLLFDGAVRDGHGGLIAKGLPLMIDYTAETVISLFGDAYEIEVSARH